MSEIVWQQTDSHTNHRRGRRLPNGEVTVEHSDDGKHWHPAINEEAISEAGHAKRHALSQGAARTQSIPARPDAYAPNLSEIVEDAPEQLTGRPVWMIGLLSGIAGALLVLGIDQLIHWIH